MKDSNISPASLPDESGRHSKLPRLRRRIEAIHPHRLDLIGYAGLFVLALCSFIFGLGDYGIVNGNESLYVESAREMALSGDWAVPTLNGLPYLEKPPLFVWLLTLASTLGNSVEWPPRLVTAGAALLLVFGVVRFSVLLTVGSRGFAAAFILITSLGIDIMSRVAMPDMLLTALFSLASFSLLVAVQRNSRKFMRLAAALLGAASLVKGALAIMLMALILGAFYWLEAERRGEIRQLLRDPFAALLLLLPFSLWLLAIEVKLPGAAWYVVVNEHILRFLGMREPHDYYSGSPLYYVPRLFLFFFPWTGVLLFGWLGKARKVDPQKRQTRRFLWLCVWVPFAFFSVSSAKANYYVLLCLPAMALLSADFLLDLMRARRKFHLALAIVIPIMVFVALWAYRIWAVRSGLTTPLLPVSDGSGAKTIAFLISLTLVVLALVQLGWRRPAILCLGGLILPLSFQIDHLAAAIEPLMSARTLASFIEKEGAGRPVYLFEDFEAIGSLPIYLNRTVPVIDSKSNDLYFGQHIRPGDPAFVASETIGRSSGEALIVVMNDRRQDFENSSLARYSTELSMIGQARLYQARFDAGSSEENSR